VKQTQKYIRVNERIRARQIRVIDHNGQQLGVMTPEEALKIARAAQLDLVEVAPTVSPPVCRVLDYSKYKYEQERKAREARKKQRVIHLKEIKFGPNIEEHDYQVKLNHLKKFLERGDKTKITVWFRGRQMAHTEKGRSLLDRLARDLSGVSEVEESPSFEGRHLTMVLKAK
jgi:translation initiation factor IF-3